MGLLDGFIQKQNEETAEGGLIDLGLNSKIYYEGADSVQNNGVDSYGNYQFVSLEDVINTLLLLMLVKTK